MLCDDAINDNDYVGFTRATKDKSKLDNQLGTHKVSKLVFLYKFLN